MPGPAPSHIRVGIVEDQDRYRGFLAALIEQSDGLTCAGQYATAPAALRHVDRDKPDVLPRQTGRAGP